MIIINKTYNNTGLVNGVFDDETFVITLDKISEETDYEWIPVLRYGKISKIEGYLHGLSKKFTVVFSNGFKASGKLMEPFSFWEKDFKKVDIHNYTNFQKRYIRRTWADYQGWAELIGFYVDRSLNIYKKPPMTGRYITNKELYSYDDSFWGFVLRNLPTYDIPVCIIAWYSEMKIKPPRKDVLENLLLDRENFNDHDEETALQVSDTLVFDFLLDDHDRIEKHNWMKDKLNGYLLWDSGLGFAHGPYPLDKDLDILCGHKDWVEITKSPGIKCRRICKFRKEFVEKIKGLGHNGTHRLSTSLQIESKIDPLYPIFQYNIYLTGKSKLEKVSFLRDNFYHGLNKRVRLILGHIDGCIKQYKEERVIIPTSDQYIPKLHFLREKKKKNIIIEKQQ